MNIWMSTHLYPTPDRPDLSSDADALHDFARQWIMAGHRVTVLHAYLHAYSGAARIKLFWPRMRLSRAEYDGVRVVRVEMRLPRSVLWLRRAFMARAARLMNRALEGQPRPDIMLCHFPAMTQRLPALMRGEFPRVGVLHSSDIIILRNKGARAMPTGFCALGFRSPKIRRDFHALAPCNGPEFMVYSGAPSLTEGGADRVEEDKLKIIYAGKLIARKQVDLLLRALHRLPERVKWQCTIIGDGPEREGLKRLIAEKGLKDRATMTGRLPREEVLERMRAHDVFAMVSYGETFGLVYLEAMACGLIPIGTADEGIDGVIENGVNGYLVNRMDEAGLAALIEGLYDMPPEQRRAIAERAQTTARRMSAPAMAADYLNQAVSAAGGLS